MGTMIQDSGLTEEDYRGERFASHPGRLQGNHDLLSLSCPVVITEIHEKYLAAGADIIETNTFNSNRISMADYRMEGLVPELNAASAKLAVAAAQKFSALTPGKPRFVAGSIGPTNRSASISPEINDPGFPSVSFDDLYSAYLEQVEYLVEGGVDLLLIETVFNLLNAKAASDATFGFLRSRGIRIPVMISFTLLPGINADFFDQFIESFLKSLSDPSFFSAGINCCVPSEGLLQYLKILSDHMPCYISFHPNAGLPDKSGNYPVKEDTMAELIQNILNDRLVNIVGGCCGTTPEYIRRIAELAEKASPGFVC